MLLVLLGSVSNLLEFVLEIKKSLFVVSDKNTDRGNVVGVGENFHRDFPNFYAYSYNFKNHRENVFYFC